MAERQIYLFLREEWGAERAVRVQPKPAMTTQPFADLIGEIFLINISLVLVTTVMTALVYFHRVYMGQQAAWGVACLVWLISLPSVSAAVTVGGVVCNHVLRGGITAQDKEALDMEKELGVWMLLNVGFLVAGAILVIAMINIF